MACPYCRSRKVREEYTVQTYDLKEDWIAINHVQCGKCGDDPRESPDREEEGVLHQGFVPYGQSPSGIGEQGPSSEGQAHPHIQEALRCTVLCAVPRTTRCISGN